MVSADGLTKSRIDILLQLLLELSNCDNEAKSAVSALQRILFELNPQGNVVFIIAIFVQVLYLNLVINNLEALFQMFFTGLKKAQMLWISLYFI